MGWLLGLFTEGGTTWPLFRFYFTRVANLLSLTTNTAIRLARASVATLMATLRRDSGNNNDDNKNVQRRMVHLQTKEECRLSSETIQVWTVELPSKHAEGILKCVPPPLTPSPSPPAASDVTDCLAQSDQRPCSRTGLD